MTDTTTGTEPETPAHLKNDKRFGDLMKAVTKFGEEASLGRDSLPKLAHAVVKAAADGVLDLETKDSKGNDAAAQIYEKYAAAESKKALHEHSAGGKKANVSKLRQLISMGCMTTIDAAEVMQEAFNAREGMKREDGVKIKPAYPYYVDVARKQLESKKPLDRNTLEALAVKEDPKPKELETYLKQALKILEGLVTGENKEKVQDTDELTEVAFNAVKERLDKMATLRAREALVKKANELGVKLA